MRLPKLILLIALISCYYLPNAECKRSGSSRGRSRGTSSSGSTFWNRKKPSNSNQPAPAPAPAPVKPVPVAPAKPKPSAPAAEPAIKRESTNVNQQHATPTGNQPQQPIGWNVPSQNGAVKAAPAYPVGSGYQGAGQGQPISGGYPNTGSSNYYGTGNNYNYGGHQQPQQFNPQQPYPGYHPTSNIGVIPPRGADHGQYYNSQSGMGHQPVFMGNGGGYPNQGGGGMFGGGRSGYGGGGYGGYGGGGYGGFGGGGYGGYGMQKSSGGLFGKHAFRNVIGGLFIWHMISGLTRKPYNVYNYYNQPEHAPEKIELPSNLLTLCSENATNLCAPGTTAICTTNGTILCVSTMATVSPCPSGFCVNSTIPCLNGTDPLCANNTNKQQEFANVDLPCFTNLTVDVNLMEYNASNSGGTTGTLTGNKDYTYCVTTFAVPGPDDVPANVNATLNVSSSSTTTTTTKKDELIADTSTSTSTENILASTAST